MQQRLNFCPTSRIWGIVLEFKPEGFFFSRVMLELEVLMRVDRAGNRISRL